MLAGSRIPLVAFVASRAYVAAVAALTVLLGGTHATNPTLYDPAGLARPFGGSASGALVGVWARWDAIWYLRIAVDGYDPDGFSPAFFPLYPGLSWIVGLGISRETVFLGGLAVALGSFAVALSLLFRLTELELGRRAATIAVLAIAVFPTSVFFSGLYTESLFLALSVAAVWFGRTDRWWLAGLAAGAATATRSAGLALLVPLALLYLLGPRGTGSGERPYLGVRRRESGPRTYPLGRDAAALALVPVGLLAYVGFLAAAGGEPLRFADAQELWQREMVHAGPVPLGPLGGVALGTQAAFDGAREIVTGAAPTALWRLDGGPVYPAAQAVELFAYLFVAAVGIVGALRRLPVAYGAYAAVALALPLTYPADVTPLFSLSRFVVVLFPVFMWFGAVARTPRRLWPPVVVSLVLLTWTTARWASWQWVA
ncbi:MAG: mannosyltransferase family protein [Solirubrobacterales bacterium]